MKNISERHVLCIDSQLTIRPKTLFDWWKIEKEFWDYFFFLHLHACLLLLLQFASTLPVALVAHYVTSGGTR